MIDCAIIQAKEDMGKKDKTEKILEDYNDVFADIFNVLVFENSVLDKNLLQDSPTESIYKSATGDIRNQFRDVDKYYIGIGEKKVPLIIAEFGIENQSNINNFMAYRLMGYDYASYRKQMDDKKSCIYPVISIVLNFSDDYYPEIMGLRECMDIPKEIQAIKYFRECGEYKVRCYNIAYLEDEIIERFTSDFKSVAYFFKEKRIHGEDYIPNHDEIKHIEAFLELIGVFTNDSEYEEIAETLIRRKMEGQVITMCEVKEAWKMSGVNALYDIVSEIKNGTKDNDLISKGYTDEIIKKAHDVINLVTSK